jgi:hypothetical protein
MRYLRLGVPALLLLVCIAPSAAQSPEAPEKSSTSSAPARQGRQPACWRRAGIAPNLVNQHWKIEDEGKARIAAVCSESSTTAQQKQAKIQLINADTEQAVASIVPAKQLQAYNACQAEVEKSRPKSPNQKELGPCGGVIPNSTPESDPSPMDH